MALMLSAADPRALDEAVRALRRGGLIAFPTDTVYGIGAHALLGEAVEKIYAVKNRPNERAIPLLLASADDVPSVAREVSPAARALMARFWPGALTLVLKKQPHIPAAVSATDSVAVRVPDHALVRRLIRALGAPLAATSANRSGQPELLDAPAIAEVLGEWLDIILDGGRCGGGAPSTVVDATVEPMRVLRAGAISPDALLRLW
ncbi:MAG: threonylcarbamoyl-AMP synthase [Chloroflexi bacterium]|nr:threonylcarbamoyl-AMP synthase [Chloroflexota bacterium]